MASGRAIFAVETAPYRALQSNVRKLGHGVEVRHQDEVRILPAHLEIIYNDA